MHDTTVTTRPTTVPAVYAPIPYTREDSPLELAVMTYLGARHGATRKLYEYWLRRFFDWCASRAYDPLRLEKAHVEQYVDWLIHDGRADGTGGLALSSVDCAMRPVIGFYRDAHDEEFISRNPCRKLRLPRYEHKRIQMLDPLDRRLFMQTAKELGPRYWALTSALCGMALRISEAASLRVEDYLPHMDQGYHLLHYVQKGGARQVTPVPLPVLQAFDAARGGRDRGPLIPMRDGRQLNRSSATAMIETVNRHAARKGLTRHINPHLLRKAAVTEAFEMNMSGRDVQAFARHADPRTTSRFYDLGRGNHHRHPAHQVAARVTAV